MASPISAGSKNASPLTSSSVDIVQEKIFITPDENFETAFFSIEYQIKSNQLGKQIPLLFYAIDYQGDFKVWIDDKEINLRDIPKELLNQDSTFLQDFTYLFDSTDNIYSDNEIILESNNWYGYSVKINDFKYFETEITNEFHTIRVEYVAKNWVDRSDWIKKYSFRYALSPAKYWKSFGELEVIIDKSKFEGELTSNLGDPSEGSLDKKAKWRFSSLPHEFIELKYKPDGPSQSTLKSIPFISSVVAGILLTILHFYIIKFYRKKNPESKFSYPLVLGSLIVPFLSLTVFMYSYDIIDALIGEHASGYHGYVFVYTFSYPIIVPIYLLSMWLTDIDMKKKYS